MKNRDEAQKHINYFENNKWRIQYHEYRARGYPIGSGVVEGQCTLVVGKQFKGNGMRWKREDSTAVLDKYLTVSIMFTRYRILTHNYLSSQNSIEDS